MPLCVKPLPVIELYQPEVLDPLHRRLEVSSKLFEDYKTHLESSGEDIDFKVWLTRKGFEQCGSSIEKIFYCSESERRAYELKFAENGVKYKSSDEELPQNKMLAIAVDTDNSIYANVFEKDKFHHSSFVAGGPVFFSGELMINSQGRISFISNLSGHYCPGLKNSIYGLEQLRIQGANLVGAKFCLIIDKFDSSRDYSCAENFTKLYLSGYDSDNFCEQVFTSIQDAEQHFKESEDLEMICSVKTGMEEDLYKFSKDEEDGNIEVKSYYELYSELAASHVSECAKRANLGPGNSNLDELLLPSFNLLRELEANDGPPCKKPKQDVRVPRFGLFS